MESGKETRKPTLKTRSRLLTMGWLFVVSLMVLSCSFYIVKTDTQNVASATEQNPVLNLPLSSPSPSMQVTQAQASDYQWEPSTGDSETATATETATSAENETPTPTETETNAEAETPTPTLSATPYPAGTETATPIATQTRTPLPTWTPTSIAPTATRTPQLPTATATSQPPTATPSTCVYSGNASFESTLVSLINQERNNQGISSLIASSQLTAAARQHSRDMACNDFFSHTGSDGSSPFQRIAWSGFSFTAAAENIYAGSGSFNSPQQAFNSWMNSPGHRTNMLNATYTHIGVGYIYCASSTYGGYFTADFARP
ncbi:MAG: CAP domain-containing protein [Anaerolineales bacterium]